MKAATLASSVFIIMASLLLTPGGSAISANQEVITDDGREVMLKEDGTWQFRSDDRYANTKDGRRVKLKPDGSWQYMGNAAMATEDHVRTTLLDIKLQKVIIEKHEKKVQKNVRLKTQTVFYINLDLSPLAKGSISITEKDVANIEVKDDKGKNYPVLTIHPSPTSLEPDSKISIAVRAKGSPTWLSGAKSMSVKFNSGVFGIKTPITLSQRVVDFEEKKVGGFEQVSK